MGVILAVGLICGGCSRAVEPTYAPGPQAVALKDAKLTQQLGEFLTKECGTYAVPKVFDQPDISLERLKHGQQVYMQRCVQCHGISGGGDGPAAEHLTPRPRDYRQGVFKFMSTLYGHKPMREDLIRTVSRGVPGTSMPSFRLLSKKEMQDVIDYVMSLTLRGELEFFLANEAAATQELTEDSFLDATETVRRRWKEAKQQTVIARVRQPEFTHEMIEAGKRTFLNEGCAKCHGADGRGASNAEVNPDTWGFPSKAADLTSGMLRGGSQPMDIYQRVYGGINGTRMPGHDNAFKDRPEAIWDIVAYVMHVSNRRREGEIPPAELLPVPPPAAAVQP